MPRLSVGSDGEFLDYTLTTPPACDNPETVVLYVHGFASHQAGEKALYFGGRFAALGCAYVTFDLRGHGASGGTMAQLTVSRAIADVEVALAWAASRFSRCVVIGSSLGGHLAAWAAARTPDRIAANLLIAPAFAFYENRVRDLGEAGLARLRAEGFFIVRNVWMTATIGRDLIDDAAQYAMERLIPRYRTPTLILHGSHDESVPVEDSVEFVRRSAARPLELAVFGGGDHRLTDRKAELFDRMRLFLQGLGLID